MKLHTITGAKIDTGGRVLLRFDDDNRPEPSDVVDLSPMLAQGGLFEPLRDPQVFASVGIGPRGRTLLWRVGEGDDDIVDLCAAALWLMAAHPEIPAAQPPRDRNWVLQWL